MISQFFRRLGLGESKSNGNGEGTLLKAISSSADERPLRAELFSISQLERHAKSLAGWHRIVPVRAGRFIFRRPSQLLPRLAANEAVFQAEYEQLTAALKRGRRMTPAAEWFIDNYYLIEEQIRTARVHLPRGYSHELPQLANGPSTGLPRVYDIALELISHVDGRIDVESIRAFVASYESISPLRLGELWAIPIMLRMALLENLRRVVLRQAAGRRDAERADRWVERMLEMSASEPGKLVLVLADIVREDPPLTSEFVAAFASRLRGSSAALAMPVNWLEQRLAEQARTMEQVFQEASQGQAADQVSIGNSIGSLRLLAATDWREFVEATSAVESTLRGEAAGVYAAMDFSTRDRYRHAVEEIARRSLMSEEQVAAAAVELARAKSSKPTDRAGHVGYFLIDRGRRELERAVGMRRSLTNWIVHKRRRFAFPIYASAIALMSCAVAALAWWWSVQHGFHGWRLAVMTVLAGFCSSRAVIAMVQWMATLMVGPRPLPRMDYSKKGIPPDCRTAVVVPTMLTSEAEIDDLLEELEIRYLASRDPSLSFVLLSDFRDAEQETTPQDAPLLEQARSGINGLNAKYGDVDGGCFFLFHRPRRWNERDRVWMGWERKRGKLEEFNAHLRGKPAQFQEIVGPVERLTDVKYVITLDTDTQLPRDAARQLVGTLAHPLNRPHYDEKLGRVTEGYGILQPLVADSLPSSGHSRFAQLFCGEPGIDPYTRAVSDVYQDVFEEGSYVGKGIYDVDAFQQAIGQRLPENQILSHDLLEGSHARAALVSDVVLYEDHPSAYPVDVSRRHRWMRGDWQIAPWLLPSVPGAGGRRTANPISILSRWKILDNMRRSLIPVAVLAFLIAGWFLPGEAGFNTLLVLGIFFVPSLLTSLEQLTRRMSQLDFGQRVRLIARSVGRQILQECFTFACLPYDAYLSVDAIARTVVRLLFTRRRLLEWRTTRDAQQSHRNSLPGFFVSMWVQPAVAAAVSVAMLIRHSSVVWITAPITTIWLAAPAVAWWLSLPAPTPVPRLSADDRSFLRLLARRTWRFFDTYVTPADNYLPPDNFQEDPPQGVAHRTSPTNMGLSLLANLAARDFGYISASNMIDRAGRTLATMDKLPRYRGHFYNWYDTRTLEILRPAYISTVDSGNLSVHLLTLAAGCEGMDGETIIPATLFDGLDATLAAAEETSPVFERLRGDLRKPPSTLTATYALLKKMAADANDALSAAGSTLGAEPRYWLTALADLCQQFLDDLVRFCPWVDLALPRDLPTLSMKALQPLIAKLDGWPTLAEVAAMEKAIREPIAASEAAVTAAGDYFRKLRAAVARGAEQAAQRISELKNLAVRCRELADIEYEFLYDPARRLLALGYHVSDHRLDAGYYDLLASEARVSSFVAIAQGQLPQEHWFSLGRQVTWAGGRLALLSWSGSMFEYLMPLLVMPTYAGTVLDETYRAIVKRQIEYGRERHVPWGISESGYNKTDAQLNYQYTAFGIPGLGFKRGLADDLVIAPYASMMALMVDPESACANLRTLASTVHMGPCGFYEAIDYTPQRIPPGQNSVTIRSYMVHHQGMGLLSLAYLLLNQPMQKRFNSDPAFRATELLLHERVPKTPMVTPHSTEVSLIQTGSGAAEPQPTQRVFTTPSTPAPELHLLSNGRYHVAVTAAGGGYSKWRDLAVTRWHEDTTRDCWGNFCYIRDTASGEFWSAAHQPTLKKPTTYEATFSQGRAEFRRRDGDVETHTEIAVSPEDDIELRRVTITNHGDARRTIEVTSYAEVVMAAAAADAAHPAFSNLFVQTKLLRKRQAILCTRRPRSASERPPWMLHLMTVNGRMTAEPSYETARSEFLGRRRTTADPAAMHLPSLLNTEGSVLDPVVAIRSTVEIDPNETVRFNLVTGAAETEEAATALIEKYCDLHLADRVFDLAWTHSQVILQQLNITDADTQLFARMAGSILYSNPQLRAPGSVIARNRRGQSGLWGHSISGDFPIVLLRIGDQTHINLVHQLVAAHAYWRVKGLAVDLVIWNEDQSGYRQALQDQILAIIASRAYTTLLDKPTGVFVRRGEQISEEDKVLMQSVARVIISDTAGTLAEQVNRRQRLGISIGRFNPIQLSRRAGTAVAGVGSAKRDLACFNGSGGFTRDGREYVVTSGPDRSTPAPWANVLANPGFGTIVSESGGAFTWCESAHGYRLTPWHNDWIGDAGGEAFYLRDEETGRFWSPTALPAPGPWPYTTRHGFGYTVFEYSDGEISTEMTTYTAIDAPAKFVVLKVRNGSGRTRRLSLTAFFELVLGEHREANQPHIVTEIDSKTGAILARNAYNSEFGERVVFLDCSKLQRTVTGDRTEFLGRNGRPGDPAAMGRAHLSGRVGGGLDPCAAMQAMFDLAQGQETEIAFVFGSGRDLNEARDLVVRFGSVESARSALSDVWNYWNRTLGTVRVETPDAPLNYLANGWLLYQTLACRIWARSGYYQCSGAFGFRDQLQDACALVHAEPGLLRAHLLRCASRQFREGDVQHWWHLPSGRGVRTRISDDFLWLAYAVCRYVAAIGDTGVLDEKVPFLDGRPVPLEEDSYFDLPTRSDESATLYEHCVRAVRHALRFGEHGLPLMGTGDWNDGMNLVGAGGKGESVWLAFFLYQVLNDFIPIVRARNDLSLAESLSAESAKLKANIEAHAWDGQWYRRAYFDDGRPLGSAECPECRIDSLPQSWAVLSSGAEAPRARQAMESLNSLLVNRDLRVIQLLDPPFDHSDLNPGYIKGYIPGVRENGGQYTHAAIWAVMAFAQAARQGSAPNADRAWELFNLINPILHGDSEAAIRKYKVEPYVAAGDVYTNLQHAGRGGWTWYTGSAGWMYRLIIESLLGVHLDVDRLRIAPVMPQKWESFQIHYRYRQTPYHILVRNLGGGGTIVRRVVCDGAEQADLTIPLADDHREHQAEVQIGGNLTDSGP
jgi:cyclic beta-1,2-glucan synthetase